MKSWGAKYLMEVSVSRSLGGRYLGRDGRVVKRPAVVSTASLLGHPLGIIWVEVAAPCR